MKDKVTLFSVLTSSRRSPRVEGRRHEYLLRKRGRDTHSIVTRTGSGQRGSENGATRRRSSQE